MLIYPHVNPIAFKLGPVAVRWYGLAYLLGFLAAWLLARRRARHPLSTWSVAEVDDLLFLCMIGVVLGGRIGWLLIYGHEALARDPGGWYKIWQGGMSFHGGVMGVIIASFVFAKRRARLFADVIDFVTPLPAIGIGVGRIANFINGELWGKPTHVPWGFAVRQADGSLAVLHPSQLYEAGLEGLVLFTIVWWFSARPQPRWAVSALFLICYSAFRIAMEFFRVPDVELGYFAFGWLTMGQILSAPMLVGGLALYVHSSRRGKRSGNWQDTSASPSVFEPC
jgi:phosphatidylglycerol:prolipoprotein diacylglycerol transferase